jgi:hypothetical protein
MCVLV